MPRDLERQSLFLGRQGETPDQSGSAAEISYQEAMQDKIDFYLLALIWLQDPETRSPTQTVHLAGLYRYVASGGLVPPERQKDILDQVGKLLKQAAASQENENETSTGHDYKRYLKGLALSELGLVLAEQSLLDKIKATSLLNEAQKHWREAEEINPRASRYARAR